MTGVKEAFVVPNNRVAGIESNNSSAARVVLKNAAEIQRENGSLRLVANDAEERNASEPGCVTKVNKTWARFSEYAHALGSAARFNATDNQSFLPPQIHIDSADPNAVFLRKVIQFGFSSDVLVDVHGETAAATEFVTPPFTKVVKGVEIEQRELPANLEPRRIGSLCE